MTISALAHAHALSENHAEALKLLAQLEAQSKKQYVSPFYIAIVYLGLGKNELALNWLEKAYSDRSNGLVFLKVEPELDPLRSDPRLSISSANSISPTRRVRAMLAPDQ